MPSFYWWAGRGQWVAEAKDPRTGKRKKRYLGPDKAEAEAEYHRWMWLLLRGKADSKPGALSLADLAGQYLEWNRTNLSIRTMKWRRTYLRWLVTDHGELPASAVSPSLIEKIKAARRRRNAPRSLNHFVTCVKGMYNWAVRQGIFETNPVRRVQGVSNAPRLQRALDDETVELMLRAAEASPPLADYLRLLLYTGMRPGELAELPWAAYDPKALTLTIARHKTVRYKGTPRIVPLSPEARDVVERQPRCGMMIFSREGGRPYTWDTFYQRLFTLRKKWDKKGELVYPGIQHVTLHALRHTFVTRLLNRGVPPWEVQRLVGHSSTLTTLYYAKADMERLRQAARLAV